MFTLTLADDPNHNENVNGTFTLSEGGVLTVHEEGLVPRIYSPTAWLRIEDFTRSAYEDRDVAVI